jgi:DNA-binding NtrC family response regulator
VQRDGHSATKTLPGRAVGNGLNLSHLLVVGGTAADRLRVARSYHDESALRLGAFVVVNCARREPQLRESLRHWLGFAGSAGAPHALWSAERGTLFLDAIGQLSRDTQQLLLEFASRELPSPPERESRRVGRLAAGCDEDPWDLVARGRFLAPLADALDKVRVELDARRRRGTA